MIIVTYPGSVRRRVRVWIEERAAGSVIHLEWGCQGIQQRPRWSEWLIPFALQWPSTDTNHRACPTCFRPSDRVALTLLDSG